MILNIGYPDKIFIKQVQQDQKEKKALILFFDVDGTLYTTVGEKDPNIENLLAVLFSLNQFFYLFAWSGGGDWYAKRVCEELTLSVHFDGFFSKLEDLPFEPDITIDDDDYTAKGKLNLKILKSK